MGDVQQFGAIVLVAATALVVAVFTTGVARRLPLPAPAIFLAAAAVASDLYPRLYGELSIHTVSRIGVVALIVILFDGGSGIGWTRLRSSLGPVVTLGVVGTFLTAGAIAVVAHYALGLAWLTAGLIGAAVAPTDPAVMFSLIGDHDIGGRAGTVLEGESGANDPVGIALVIGLLDLARTPGGSFTIVVSEFALEMVVGLAVGLAAGYALRRLLPRLTALEGAPAPLLTLALAGCVYGIATLLGGSGFLAVFVAGLAIGDTELPHQGATEAFRAPLASLAEIVVFVALGMTVRLHTLTASGIWTDGLVIALALALVVRPAVTLALLAPTRMPHPERRFVAWAGLRGAVPILLAAFTVLEHVASSERIYGIVFVVVLVSVVVQGSTVSLVARALGVQIRPGAGESA
ncbi:MAG TPA: cation:proton antiporter [Gaiellales bacterium]|nr:cation:proton antiporter [Gaiellales bacterium]